MSHRDELTHAPGVAERGNDWLDGALAGWLLFIAIGTAPYVLQLRDGIEWPRAAWAATPFLAVLAIFPLLRFHRIGWFLALLALGMMVAHEAMDLAAGTRPRAAGAFLVVHLLGLAYLLWIIPEFWPKDNPDAAPASVGAADGGAALESTESAEAAPPAAPAAPPIPVTLALASIHQRIVAAGSACAVTPVSVRAEAGRFGVTPAVLRTEGLALYRTFLQHFLADGQLSPDEERELICLERALDLDDDGVWRLRGEAGLRGGLVPATPALPAESSAATVETDDADRAIPPTAGALATDDAVRSTTAASDADHPVPSMADGSDVDDAALSIMDTEDPVIPSVADASDADHPIPSMAFGSDADDVVPSITDDREAGPARDELAPAPHPSAQADIALPLPRIHSPGSPSDAPVSPSIDESSSIIDEAASTVDEPSSTVDNAASTIDESIEPAEPLRNDFAERAAAGEIAPPDVPAEMVEPAAASLPFDVAEPAGPEALHDYEEHELRALLRWAGIPALPRGAPPRAALDRLRALHRTTTEPLDACAADQPLEPGERCLAIRTVELYRVPPGAPPAPPAPDLPGPVLDPRALVDGSLERDRDLSAFQRTGVCRFLLTERRLLLVAPSGQQSPLPVSRLRAVHPFHNGLEVQPQRGHPVFLAFTGGVDDVAMLVDRAAADLRASA